ncbi:MAG: hypothetical protein R3A45_09825 [Bdellovibrionota bacterium]
MKKYFLAALMITFGCINVQAQMSERPEAYLVEEYDLTKINKLYSLLQGWTTYELTFTAKDGQKADFHLAINVISSTNQALRQSREEFSTYFHESLPGIEQLPVIGDDIQQSRKDWTEQLTIQVDSVALSQNRFHPQSDVVYWDLATMDDFIKLFDLDMTVRTETNSDAGRLQQQTELPQK